MITGLLLALALTQPGPPPDIETVNVPNVHFVYPSGCYYSVQDPGLRDIWEWTQVRVHIETSNLDRSLTDRHMIKIEWFPYRGFDHIKGRTQIKWFISGFNVPATQHIVMVKTYSPSATEAPPTTFWWGYNPDELVSVNVKVGLYTVEDETFDLELIAETEREFSAEEVENAFADFMSEQDIRDGIEEGIFFIGE